MLFALQEQDQADAALDCFEAALATDPEDWRAHMSLGILYSRRAGPADMELAHLHLSTGLLYRPLHSEGWCVHPLFNRRDGLKWSFRL